MTTLEDILAGDTLQSLNDDKLKRFTIKKDKYSHNSMAAMSEAIGQVYSDGLSDDGQTIYEARCLASLADPTGNIPGETGNGDSNSKFLVKVIARIPKLHAAIPKPDSEFCERERSLAIMMHPVFYSKQADSSIPEPGNLIKVRFFTNGQSQYGEYLGIIDPTQKATKAVKDSARELLDGEETPTKTAADYQQEFNDILNDPDLSNRQRAALASLGFDTEGVS